YKHSPGAGIAPPPVSSLPPVTTPTTGSSTSTNTTGTSTTGTSTSGTSTTTTTPTMSFTDKCAQSGVVGCWDFDDPSELKYTWDNSSPALNAALAGRPHYSISNFRTAGEGNTFATQQISGALSVPAIDNTIYSSGGGSLKFTIPSQSGQQAGYFIDN